MINIDLILGKIISVLNANHLDSFVAKNYIDGNKPPYPYATIGVTTSYIPENENNRPVLLQSFDNTKNQIALTRKEQPTVTLSMSIFSEDREEASKISLDYLASLKFILKDELASYGIIVVGTSSPRQITDILETDYEFRYQFDITIRVDSTLVKYVDATEKVTIEGNDKVIEIKE